jgi:beta-phosphoglucomutase-like phosphatase (HAD superfamily)
MSGATATAEANRSRSRERDSLATFRVATRSTPPLVAHAAARPEPGVLAARWQRALDATDRALLAAAADRSLTPAELSARRRDLARERQQSATDLAILARLTGRPAPWLSAVPVTNRMLGLPVGVRACLFDLDGVLTDSGALHAWAWGEVFDDFLLRSTEKTGWHFIPFDRNADYRAFVDGASRLEAVHAFLGSRGIRIAEGRLDDEPSTDTAHGLAKRKGAMVARGLRQRGVTALEGARRYLEAAGHAGLGRAVVSASTSTQPMLQLAGLDALVEERVDAAIIRTEALRSRPAPDLPLAACRRLDIPPEAAVTFTQSAAGIAAGHSAGLLVVGVGEGENAELLSGFGAERVVPSLGALLDPRLREPPV